MYIIVYNIIMILRHHLVCFGGVFLTPFNHLKAFHFLCKWGCRLSPTYNLTYSNFIGGKHATLVNGNVKNPSINDILIVVRNLVYIYFNKNHTRFQILKMLKW